MARAPRKDYRPGVESLDQKILLSTFTVTDPGDAGPGTLRDAITQSNADSAQPNTIGFALDATHRAITLATPLPAVTAPATIDGTSTPAAPAVALAGSAGAPNGMTIAADNSTVKGLDFQGFSGTALLLQGANTTVQGNLFGTAGDGTTPKPNGTAIRVVGSSETIGGTAAGQGNLIANNATGISIADHAHGNAVVANTLVGNTGPAVSVVNSDRNRISQNTIAGNSGPGILLDPRVGDVAPNGLLASPVFISMPGNGNNVLVSGTIRGTPSTTGYRVEFFASALTPGAQGDTYLGSVTADTDATGSAPISFTYTPVPGKPVVTATVTDPLGNTSAFSGQNAVPVNSLPGAQTLDQDLPLVFSSANNNRITVTDPFRPDNAFRVDLSVTNGTLTLPSVQGLTGTGNGTGTLSYTGNLAQLNTALNGLTYRSATPFLGTATLSLTTTSLDGAGLGGALSKTDTTAINVRSINMPPNATSSFTVLNQQSTTGLVITPSPYGPRGVTSFQISGITHGKLFLADGVTPVAEGSFVNVQQAAAGLRFTPDHDFIGVGTLQIRASRDGTAAGLAGPATSESITVNRVLVNTTLATSDADAVQGQAVTLTSSVSPVVDGTITFKDGNTTLGTVALTQGTATLKVSDLSVGTHALTAVFSGAGNQLAGLSPAIIQTVTSKAPGNTATLLGASSTSLTVGQPVTLTAAVTPAPGGGTVSFLDGTTILGTENVVGGVASLTIPVLTAGTHNLTAVFNGTGTAALSRSAAVTVNVQNPTPIPAGSTSGSNSNSNSGGSNSQGSGSTTTHANSTGGGVHAATPVATTTLVTVTLGKLHRRQVANITAVVVPGHAGALPTGTVTFYGPPGTPLQSMVVSGGATITLPIKGRPRGSVMAVYNGGTGFLPSYSAPVPLAPPPLRGHR